MISLRRRNLDGPAGGLLREILGAAAEKEKRIILMGKIRKYSNEYLVTSTTEC
jgi:hypothetical protein